MFTSQGSGNYSVGVIEKGNTAIIADMIAERTGGSKFEVVPFCTSGSSGIESWNGLHTLEHAESIGLGSRKYSIKALIGKS